MKDRGQLVDSHCHIHFPEFFDDLDAILTRAAENNVGYLLCVSVDLNDFNDIQKLTCRYPNVYSSIGVHPNADCSKTGEPRVKDLTEASYQTDVVAIGETGLDYLRSKGDLGWQKDRFRTHINAAKSLGLPLIIHTRDSKEDTLAIMREEKAKEVGGVMHCFTGDWEMASQALDLGFYISFSGIVTFGNAEELRSVAQKVPSDRLLVETDAPYLSPIPMRGKRNEPAFVRHTAAFLAGIRGQPERSLSEQTTENFFRLFKKAASNRVT